MNLEIKDIMIPGTKFRKSDVGNVTGLEFLNKIFFVSDGVMLTQIREVSGIDGSTLQNWTKRGWVANAKLKKYNIDQVAHILIINMLRSCVRLDHIAFMLHYINGDINDRSDDIIRESVLYDHICHILDKLNAQDACSTAAIKEEIDKQIADYVEPFPGAKERLGRSLEIIVVAYYAATLKRRSDELITGLMNQG